MQFQDSYFTKGINYDTTAPHKSFLTCIWHTKATSLDKTGLCQGWDKNLFKFSTPCFLFYITFQKTISKYTYIPFLSYES